MADNFTQFSFAIPLDGDEQMAWARRAVAYIFAAAEVDLDPDELVNIEGDGEFRPILPDDETVDFVPEIDQDGIWIHTDDTGTPEHVVGLIQAFLAKFDPEGYIGFEWADTCSRPILDSFGGGAVFITATDARWMASSTWLGDQMHKHYGEMMDKDAKP